MQTHDLIVLGAGSGGIATAIRAARHGARVALLEPSALGGTCVNVGCVPKKAMWLAAELMSAQRIAATVGFSTTPGTLDWPAFVERRERYIRNIHASYQKRFDDLGIERIQAYGKLLGDGAVAAGDRRLQAPHILLATGAHAFRPNVPGANLGIDSDGFFALRAAPRTVAVVGAGYIAFELAGVLQMLGSEVTMLMRGERALSAFDGEATAHLTELYERRGTTLLRNVHITGVDRRDGKFHVSGEGAPSAGFDELVWATGRRPNIEALQLELGPVVVDGQGFVTVDAQQCTSAKGIYAVGDITPELALTPVAIKAGRALADRLFGNRPDAKLDADNVPTVVFSHPPLANVGMCEEAARAKHGDAIKTYCTRFRPMLDALADHDERTFMKLVCLGADEKVIGVQMVGTAVDEILQGFAVAVKLGATKADFDATVAIHPTSAEELVLMG